MTIKKRLHFLFAVPALIVLAGCGGGNSPGGPTPQGTFNNSSLNGSYAFSVTGTDVNGFFAIAGSLQANGQGLITGGSEDVNLVSGVFTNLAVNGTYNVLADGRGSATLNSSQGSINLAFVLTGGGHAMITRFENSATGSGSMDLQTSAAFTNGALQGAFVFNLSGIDAANSILQTAGVMNMDGAGNIPSGIQDSNDNGTVLTAQTLSGIYGVTPTGRGTIQVTTALGNLGFAFYVVDSNHIKMVETDAVPVLAGDAFRQQGPLTNAALTGPFAFTVGGSSTFGAFVAGGVLNADGAGNVTSGTEDTNNNGTLNTAVAFNGAYSLAASGRGTLTLNSTSATSNFSFYPSTGGIQMLELDANFVTAGAAFSQQALLNNASLQGGYGMSFTGVLLSAAGSSEVDATAQLTADGNGKTTGIMDLNSGGSLAPGGGMTSTYSLASVGTMTVQTVSFGTQNLILYPVSGNKVLFIEADTDVVAVGSLLHQQ